MIVAILIFGVFFILRVTKVPPQPVKVKHLGGEKVEINPQVCLLCFHSPSIMG